MVTIKTVWLDSFTLLERVVRHNYMVVNKNPAIDLRNIRSSIGPILHGPLISMCPRWSFISVVDFSEKIPNFLNKKEKNQ